SKTVDDASDFDEQPESPFDLRAERALSRNHQGHHFVLSALYDLPFGEEEEKSAKPTPPETGGSDLLGEILGHIEIAPIVTIGSGRPINPLTGLDSNRSHALPISSRPLGFGRTTLRSPAFATVDLLVLKYFRLGEHGKLDIAAEVFNLFNRANVSQLNQFFGSDRASAFGFAR